MPGPLPKEGSKKEPAPPLKKKIQNAGIAWVVIGIVSLAITLIFYFFETCFSWWLIVGFFALHILIYQFLVPSKPEQKRKVSYFVIFQIAVFVLAVILGLIKNCLWVWVIILILAIVCISNKK